MFEIQALTRAPDQGSPRNIIFLKFFSGRHSYNMDNNFGFFNAKLYCEGALILVCVFVEL